MKTNIRQPVKCYPQTNKKKGFLEWNDMFFIFFGAIGASLIALGFNSLDYRLFIGLGITLYGLTYISLHDVFIHQRIKLFRNLNNRYFKAMRKAHRAHHRHTGREDGEAFGLLWFAKEFYEG